ncbi:MAG TPA: DUF4395 domain-containing protein [Acidimicrobiales bacterium]|jgi:hypothetical protein
MALPRLLRFPNPVNEVAARVVAGGVLVTAIAFLVTDQGWILLLLAYGFVARVLTGPRLSPLGQFATRVAAPRLGTKLVPGPPKRFAQGIGAVVTVSAAVAWWAGASAFAFALVGLIVAAATLESLFAYCIGCRVFAALMRVGVIPPDVCEACNDLRLQLRPR